MERGEWNVDRILFTPTNLYLEYVVLNFNSYLKNNLTDIELTMGELTYIYNVKYTDDISQRELAELLFVSEANVTKMITKLEKKGYVLRETDETNKSRRILSLTDKGEEVLEKAHKVSRQWERHILKEVPYEDLMRFKEILFYIAKQAAQLNG